MTRDPALYERVARIVATSPDPRRELLEIARLQSRYERRRAHLRWAGAALAAACVVLALVLFLRPHAAGSDPDVTDPIAFSRWAEKIEARKELGNVSAEEEARLRRSLDNPSSLARRAALLTLLIHHRTVSPEILLRIGTELEETLDRSVEVAGTQGGDVQEALRDARRMTLSAVSLAIWLHCAREGTFPDVGFIESLARNPDPQIRKCSYHALSALPDYRPTPELLERVRAEKARPLKQAGAALLMRAQR